MATQFNGISINRWFTGLYSHRNPLMTPYTFAGLNVLQRNDALLDGANAELTDLFTIKRRFGFSTFCFQSLSGSEVLRNVQSFKDLFGNVHLLADLTTSVSAITPSSKTVLFSENSNSARCSIQKVASTCYFANSKDAKKWLINASWASVTQYSLGDVITDADGVIHQVTAISSPYLSGSTEPVWNHTVGGQTLDATLIWTCRGDDLQGIGVARPAVLPIAAINNYVSSYTWSASTYFPDHTYVLGGTSDTVFKVVGEGISGNSEPSWNTSPGSQTEDGTVVWEAVSSSLWQASTAYSVGNVVIGGWMTQVGQAYQFHAAMFQCTVAGTSGSTKPDWSTASLAGTTISDGGVTWKNVGPTQAWHSAISYKVAPQIVDSNTNIQEVQVSGITGSSQPTWATAEDDTTVDGGVTWVCKGPATVNAAEKQYYSYAYKSSATHHVSSRSSRSVGVLNMLGMTINVSGQSCPDPFYDLIQLYRTKAGGSVDYLLAEIPNSGTGWEYSDNSSDDALNTQIVASIGANDPPPAGITNLCFYAGRMWGSVKNVVYFASGPDSTIGVPEESWNMLNYFVFPSEVILLFPIPGGLLVFLEDDLYEIFGTDSSSFYPDLSQAKLGIANPDAVAFDGTNLYIYTSLKQLWLVNTSGNEEAGFNVAEILDEYFPPATTSLTILRSGLNESALYVTSGTGYMLRYSLNTKTWSPLWHINNGVGKAWATEISPQSYKLLTTVGSTIVQRDTTTHLDMGVAYTWFFTLGMLNVAAPGSITDIESLALHLHSGGSLPTVSYLPDDLDSTFSILSDPQNEPPLLSPGTNLTGSRWYLSSNSNATPTAMQHVQIKVAFPAENQSNEIFQLDIMPKEAVEA